MLWLRFTVFLQSGLLVKNTNKGETVFLQSGLLVKNTNKGEKIEVR
ncbi:MAG: hypothetical protein NW207_03300 [Cytophagales bacterium]|nr:hypothetical protein [Cytophagales bacterium]